MPPLASMMRGRRGISSVQWTEPGRAALAGDASLARDALSSQGIAASLSDGFYAAAAVGTDALARLHRRQERSIAAHLTSLGDALSRCRFRDRPMWRAYEGFVRGQTRVVERSDEIALQEGRLVTAFAP
jgi:flavin-dependent dehydrogenase